MSLASCPDVTGTHSIWLGAVLLVGCGFEAAPGEEDMLDDPTPPIIDPTIDRKCSSDADLKLCIDFEDPATSPTDGSGKGHHPVVVAGLTTLDRDAELAVEMSASSKIQIAEHADFDITSKLTVSMWVNSAVRPAAGSTYWLLDNNNQYSMSIQPDGSVRCGLGPDTVDSATELNVVADGWHQVACTYDGNVLKVYIDGWVAGCESVGRAIATTGMEGLSIGSNIGASVSGPVFSDRFVGGLDNVQVFSRTWSSAELCAATGAGWCSSTCPVYSGGGGGGDDD
jgi:hypothetical protein